MHNVEATNVPLTVDDDTGTPHVSAASDHDNVTGLELDVVDNLVVDKVELDSVVDLDGRVRVTDGAAVVADEVRNTLGAELVLADLEELEGSLLGGDAVDGETTLDVVQETEVLTRALKGDDVWAESVIVQGQQAENGSCDIATEPFTLILTHEASGVGLVGPDLAVNLDDPLLENGGNLTTGQGVLETVAEEDGQGERLAELVGTGRRAGGLREV